MSGERDGTPIVGGRGDVGDGDGRDGDDVDLGEGRLAAGPNEEPSTHTSALQGAAAGGALSGNAGYAGGLFTGSENDTGMADIRDAEDKPKA